MTDDRLHELLGRRYEFADGSAPDVTIVAYDPQKRTARLHAADGGRQHLPLSLLISAIEDSALLESARPPFVHPPERRR